MIIRWQKDQDYYIVRMYQDLVGDWIVAQSWGSSPEQKNACSQTVMSSCQDARVLVREIRKHLKSEGFRLVVREETQLGFEFDPCQLQELEQSAGTQSPLLFRSPNLNQ